MQRRSVRAERLAVDATAMATLDVSVPRALPARRRFLFALVLCAGLTAPRPGAAQPARKTPRIGILTLASSASTPIFDAFREGLRELGYVEGQNIVLEFRFARGRHEALNQLAAELVSQNVDVILTDGGATTLAAKNATRTIPIVMGTVGDPVAAGLVATLARPGANVTGFTLLSVELSARRLQLLREAVPHVTRVAVLWNPRNPTARRYLEQTRDAARTLGMDIASVEVRGAGDLDAALDAVAATRAGAFTSLADAILWNHRRRLIDFATRQRLPGMFPEREFVDDGGLISYGPSVPANFRRAASYVDRILKGAQPADLPVEQPTKFELVINLKTARALGLAIPRQLLLRADHVLE